MSRVTVVMPAYNAQAYIAEAIDSVLAQTLTDFDLLVVDDGSLDDTAAVAEAVDDPRVRVIRREHAGVAETRNAGLALARGDYVAMFDADDLMTPDRLARQVAALDADPRIVVCGSDYREFGARDAVVRLPRSAAACRARLLFAIPVTHGSSTFRRSALEGIRVRTEYLPAEDYQLISELATRGDVVNLPFVGLRYRIHPQQTSEVATQGQRTMTVRIARENLDRAGRRAPVGLDRLLWLDGRGIAPALGYLARRAPQLLWLSARAGGLAGLGTAAQYVRERLNSALR